MPQMKIENLPDHVIKRAKDTKAPVSVWVDLAGMFKIVLDRRQDKIKHYEESGFLLSGVYTSTASPQQILEDFRETKRERLIKLGKTKEVL